MTHNLHKRLAWHAVLRNLLIVAALMPTLARSDTFEALPPEIFQENPFLGKTPTIETRSDDLFNISLNSHRHGTGVFDGFL